MRPTFPFGYARPPNGGPQGMGTMLTWEQMLTKPTVNLLHPEVQRRFNALIEAARRGCSVGGRHRLAGPAEPAAGRVRQARQLVARVLPGVAESPTALAIDTVPNISWDWMHVHCGRLRAAHFQLRQQRAVARPAGRDLDEPQLRHEAAGADHVAAARRTAAATHRRRHRQECSP